MAASFNGASQTLKNLAPPFISLPFSVGMWVYPTTTGTLRSVWSFADTTDTGNRWLIQQSATNAWQFNCTAAGSGFSIILASTVIANQWAFLVARAPALANRQF